jgi:hypothetical protein
MIDMLGKVIPDLLTLLRVACAVAMAGSALAGRADLSRDIWLLVASWTTDMVDGRLSRSLSPGYSSWLGKNDVYIDMFVSLVVLFYLGVTGLLPLWAVLAYLLVWGVLFLWKGIPPLFAQVFQNPIYAYFVILTLQQAPQVLPWLLLWALVGLLLFGRRLVELYNDSVRFLRR